MIKIGIIGSGSKGNCIVVENHDFSFVIDCGYNLVEFMRRAAFLKLATDKISCILLSHAHQDHISGVSLLSEKLQVPVLCHADLRSPYLKEQKIFAKISLQLQKTHYFKERRLKIYPFETFHDIQPSCGFYLGLDDIKILYLTDTGVVNPEMEKLARHSRVIFLEANYDANMLESGPYPPFLKGRIKSDMGHLSNEASIAFIQKIFQLEKKGISGEKKIFLCHLSGENNCEKTLAQNLENNFTRDAGFHFRKNKNYFSIRKDSQHFKIHIISRDKAYAFKVTSALATR
jgi:phosphoribosyl 1,2-cyclic phosphodiesterase